MVWPRRTLPYSGGSTSFTFTIRSQPHASPSVAQAFDAGSRDGRIGRDQAIDAMPADGVGDRLDFIAAEIRGHLDDERDRTSMALRELCPIARQAAEQRIQLVGFLQRAQALGV